MRGRQLLQTALWSPLTLLLARKGVLQPRQVVVLTVNFISPPTVGVAIWMVRV